nr:hypothetical protein [uncultured Methanoregula sp.]
MEPGNNQDISFELVDQKPVPDIPDPSTREIRNQVIRKIEKDQVTRDVKKELGIEDPPKPEPFMPIPEEVPRLLFRFGSSCIKCPAFCLDDSEAKILSTHINRIAEYFHINIGIVGSILVILVIVVSKVVHCKDAIMGMFKKKDDATTEKTS